MKKLLTTTAVALLLSTGIAYAGPHGGEGGDRMRQHEARMEEALKKLPPEKADMVRTTFKEMREERKASWDGKKDDREEMDKLMAAPKFDKAAFMAKAREKAQEHEAQRLKGAERIANMAEKLSPEERKVLLEAMPHPGGHKGPQGEGKMRGGEMPGHE